MEDNENLYFMIGAIFAVILTAVGVWIFRQNRKSSEQIQARPARPSDSTNLINSTGEGLSIDQAADSAPELVKETQGGVPHGAESRPEPTSIPTPGTKNVTSETAARSTQGTQAGQPAVLQDALSATRQNFFGRLKNIFTGQPKVAGHDLEMIEEVLYTSDLGPKTVQRLLTAVQKQIKTGDQASFEVLRLALRKEIVSIFSQLPERASLLDVSNAYKKPMVLMIIGVNGAGKTTTIGKLSAHLAQNGKRVLVAAGDTFRAAAGEQLKVWTERAQVEIFSPPGITDPSAVAFDACQKGLAQGFDVIIIDTAGRLHTQKNLMEELKKMKRVIAKVMPEGPDETLLVLDANSGQNALIQAKEFHEALGVSGVILTKMDGSAKGGVAVGVACELQVPIRLIGVGEKLGDLRLFSSQEFVDSIF